jgi:hypothetical protein
VKVARISDIGNALPREEEGLVVLIIIEHMPILHRETCRPPSAEHTLVQIGTLLDQLHIDCPRDLHLRTDISHQGMMTGHGIIVPEIKIGTAGTILQERQHVPRHNLPLNPHHYLLVRRGWMVYHRGLEYLSAEVEMELQCFCNSNGSNSNSHFHLVHVPPCLQSQNRKLCILDHLRPKHPLLLLQRHSSNQRLKLRNLPQMNDRESRRPRSIKWHVCGQETRSELHTEGSLWAVGESKIIYY